MAGEADTTVADATPSHQPIGRFNGNSIPSPEKYSVGRIPSTYSGDLSRPPTSDAPAAGTRLHSRE